MEKKDNNKIGTRITLRNVKDTSKKKEISWINYWKKKRKKTWKRKKEKDMKSQHVSTGMKQNRNQRKVDRWNIVQRRKKRWKIIRIWKKIRSPMSLWIQETRKKKDWKVRRQRRNEK